MFYKADERANTDSDYYSTVGRRTNLIKFWAQTQDANKFVATHLYGAIGNLDEQKKE